MDFVKKQTNHQSPHTFHSFGHELKQMQQLMMSRQMQQALSILQLPILELSTVISEELEQNPILEREEEDTCHDESEEESAGYNEIKKIEEESCCEIRDYPFVPQKELEQNEAFLENYCPYNLSLFEFLMKQAYETFEDSYDREMAEWLIGNLDEFGFLQNSLEELASLKNYSLSKLNKVLDAIQTFDPVGIGAQNLQQSLLIQLERKGKKNTLAYKILKDYYQQVIHHQFNQIGKSLLITSSVVQETIDKEIATFDLHPGLSFKSNSNLHLQTIIPDVYITRQNGTLEIIINEESIPCLKINSKYLKLLKQSSLSNETRHYIQNKIASGKWLLKSIEQRNTTLYNIVSEIAQIQKDFLFLADGKLNPLTMKHLSERLSLNESTIARAIANKYVDCPRGIISLKFFLSNGLQTESGDLISSKSVKDLIKNLIKEENQTRPLSDEEIAVILKEKGIQCARRTVAKYRNELHIGNACQRKKFS